MKTKKNKVKAAVSMQRELLETTHDINNVLTTSKKVAPIFGGHYFDMATGENGLQSLISQILREHNATVSKGMLQSLDNPELGNVIRASIIADNSMFTKDIIGEVESRFAAGTNRYKYVHAYLSIVMTKNKKVGHIKLTNDEDAARKCNKPRYKWFLIEQ
jgi:hypothetical protein